MKPSAVSGNPVSASQDAAPASVTHSASSKAMRLPSAQISAPGSTRTISLSVSTAMSRRARIRSNSRRTRGLCDGSSASRVTSVTSTAPLHRPASRCCAESASSTPAAPPPTTARRSRGIFCARASNASHRPAKWAIGLTAIVCSTAPGTSSAPRRRADVDRQQVPADRRMGAAQCTARPARSRPIASSRISRAPAKRASRPRSIWHSSKVVMAGDIARQHARIGRLDIAADQA